MGAQTKGMLWALAVGIYFIAVAAFLITQLSMMKSEVTELKDALTATNVQMNELKNSIKK